jgi:hypothetical protein
MLDHGARDVTAGLPEVKEYPGLLGFERPDTASDIVGIISGEETGDVVAAVCARHRDSRRHTPGQVQRHFDADGSGLLETGSGLFFSKDSECSAPVCRVVCVGYRPGDRAVRRAVLSSSRSRMRVMPAMLTPAVTRAVMRAMRVRSSAL